MFTQRDISEVEQFYPNVSPTYCLSWCVCTSTTPVLCNTCTHMHTHTHTDRHTHARAYTCIRTCTSAYSMHTHTPCTHTHMHAHTHPHAHIGTQTHTHSHTSSSVVRHTWSVGPHPYSNKFAVTAPPSDFHDLYQYLKPGQHKAGVLST